MNKTGFWGKIEKESDPGGCWVWEGAMDDLGYGRVRFEGKVMLTHRLAYALAYGDLGDGDCVCHKCDNPRCCNPAHLFKGSRLDNNLDMVQKGRHGARISPGYHKAGEQHWCAKLSEQQVAEIAIMYRKGGISQRKLAEQYRVSQRTIAKIVLGIGWKHVSKPNAEAK